MGNESGFFVGKDTDFNLGHLPLCNFGSAATGYKVGNVTNAIGVLVWDLVARLVIDAHVVVPVGVHIAFVAVAKRGVAQGQRAGAGWLEDTWALIKDWGAVVIVVVATTVVTVGFDLAELGCVLLEHDGLGGSEESSEGKELHLLRRLKILI